VPVDGQADGNWHMAVTATPQTFITGDGWFTYNLVANLAQM